MKPAPAAVLFVSNGYGEIAIAARIAREVQAISPLRCEHLPLVSANAYAPLLDVGPHRSMPSGGLVAMGNLRNIARDLAAGLAGLTLAQFRFLRAQRGKYAAAIAVGDVWALVMALQARARATIFVGTAKSVRVAPYGRIERRIIGKADHVFVRDPPTARSLQRCGIAAQAANVIADMHSYAGPNHLAGSAQQQLAIFPGSRSSAYDDARFLLDVVRRIAREQRNVRAILSIAPGLAPEQFTRLLRADGWRIEDRPDSLQPFSGFTDEGELVRAWSGELGAILQVATLVLGQAGTANEAAAAAGIPIVAFVPSGERKKWYRRRQAQLLGDALLIVPRDPAAGARAVRDLLRDPQRLQTMARAGREQMGPPGASRAIAERIVKACA